MNIFDIYILEICMFESIIYQGFEWGELDPLNPKDSLRYFHYCQSCTFLDISDWGKKCCRSLQWARPIIWFIILIPHNRYFLGDLV